MGQKKRKYITDEEGNQSVVIPVEEYEEILEDIEDLVAVAERKQEPNVSLESVLENLKKDGLIQS